MDTFRNNILILKPDHIKTPVDLKNEFESIKTLPEKRLKIKTLKLRQKFSEIIETHLIDENKKSYFLHQLQYAHNFVELESLLKELT